MQNESTTSPRQRWHLGVLVVLLSVAAQLFAIETSSSNGQFILQPGQHICIIGNTLAERMQHDGWLETLLHQRFPQHDLTIRNLGFSGDELAVRLRSQSFGSPDEWLAGNSPIPEPQRLVTRLGVRENRFATTQTRADVVFAFFGYNESFGGEAGLPRFQQQLTEFVRHTLAQKYNGTSAPRLVLFSPIAHEDHHSPHLPDGRVNNERLERYTLAMAAVAKSEKVHFVDLFHPSRELYAQASHRLTINGIHLNSRGNEAIAQEIDRALFGAQPRALANQEALRAAVCEKNRCWFHRYRVVDGYNVYGGRAFEKYTRQQSNYEDQQRELEILDVMTANRERRAWALAKGGDYIVDDTNCPPLIPVTTNKPGSGPGGSNLFLGGEEAIEKMTLAKGMKATLFASEREFPELAKPVQMQFDAHARLWVAVWPSYPHWNPTEKLDDKLLVFEDTRGTGKADKCTVFAGGLHCPTGFEFCNGGVLLAQPPDLWFLKDTDGDGKADVRERVLHGLDSADTHHAANSFSRDPGGAIYFQEGTFHRTQVESPYGPPRRCADAGVYRFDPRTQRFDVYVTHPFANPHGHVWDRWGQDFVYDGTGAQPYHGALFSGQLEFPRKHPSPPQVYQQRTRPCPGVEILSSGHFPVTSQGNLLVANVIGFQGILQYKLHDQGASFAATESEPLLSSTDPNFRPSDLKIGPDGAIWFIDWHNPIIGHLQHALRDPNRDRTHGRIYRISRVDQPLSPRVDIAGESVTHLLNLLKHPEMRVCHRARIELATRDTREVMNAARLWREGLDRSDVEFEHHLLEALWLHQAHNQPDEALLRALLASRDFRARAAATRVLCEWRERIPEALPLLRQLSGDPHPRVRLEAMRAASYFNLPEALEIVLLAAELPTDPYLDYVAGETRKALEPYVKKAVAEGKSIPMFTPVGQRGLVRLIDLEDLLRLPRTVPVYQELLTRSGVRDETRAEAATMLARHQGNSVSAVVIDALRLQGAATDKHADSVVYDLCRLLTGRSTDELRSLRPSLEQLALGGKTSLVRQVGFVSLIAADAQIEPAWTLALGDVTRLCDLVAAMPLVRDPALRQLLYPKVVPLLTKLPQGMTQSGGAGEVVGRYVRIDLPGKNRPLTLAEVEVLSGGRNVARQGKAKQSGTAHGGNANRAIDGNRAGQYSAGGQTHTPENGSDPWWELDLGTAVPIQKVIVFNRTDANLGHRLQGFSLQVLDEARRVVYAKREQPAPAERAAFDLGAESPARVVRRLAMLGLTSVRGSETRTFTLIAPFVNSRDDRADAIETLLRLPASYWPPDAAPALLRSVLDYLRELPATERTSIPALHAIQLAESLINLLPVEVAKPARRELGALGVHLVRLSTLPEQMAYDKERFVVGAGKPVEICFENTDLMLHNLVFTEPGALEEIGLLAEANATQPGALERHYVPSSARVFVASKLLQPRESQVLRFVAPAVPGIYPFVCTYPGHWRRMYGAMVVVADYPGFQENPDTYFATHPMPAQDALLHTRRLRADWKFEDLAADVEKLNAGRSYRNGKQMFQVANCIACHKLNGEGHAFGPDLAQLDSKLKPTDVLRELLDPSASINDKYHSFTFELQSGKVLTGIILEETAEAIKLVENPLASAEPRVLKPAEVVERKKSPVSLMPKGLLDKLTREEILDLIAYVYSRGQASHPLFQAIPSGGHGHGAASR